MEQTKNKIRGSAKIADMKIIAHNEDILLLYPSKIESDISGLRTIHDHIYYEFFFATEQTLNILTEKGTYSFNESVIVVPPKFKHTSYSLGGGNFCINVTASDVNKIGNSLGLLDFVKKDDLTSFKLSGEIAYYLKKLLDANFSSMFGRAKSEALLRLIFLAIGETLAIASEENQEKDANPRFLYIQQVDNFVANNYTNPNASIEDLAEKMHLSSRQVARIIKKEYDSSFTELMNEKKMGVASILLKKSSLSIGQIIEELNFGTENYFFRVFKKKFGVTPLKYRKDYHKQL
jgi:AraC-like DNA-binding protein